MKAIVTLIFILFISMSAQAQNGIALEKVSVIQSGIVIGTQEAVIETPVEVARLYRRTNSRVKKALFFTTKRNAPKLA
jgi:hypothetical protein